MSKFTQLSPDSNPGQSVTTSWASGPFATLLASSRRPSASQKLVVVQGATVSSWWWRDDHSQHPQERDPPLVPEGSSRWPWTGPFVLGIILLVNWGRHGVGGEDRAWAAAPTLEWNSPGDPNPGTYKPGLQVGHLLCLGFISFNWKGGMRERGHNPSNF